MIEARILLGIHFRRADVNGAALGELVADFVDKNFFNCGAAWPVQAGRTRVTPA